MSGKEGRQAVRDGFDGAGVAKAVHAGHDTAQLLLRGLEFLHHGREKVMVGVVVPVHAFRHFD